MSLLSRRLLIIAIVWTALLMSLGAYVRLQDAGLGCPDWPGCYGHFTVPDEHHEIAHATNRFGVAVDVAKGWKEMIHRYVAGGLGLLMIMLAGALWRDRRRAGLNPWQAILPLSVIVLQGAFGMWTVTLKLMPVVVTGHLIGGMTLLMILLTVLARSRVGWSIDQSVSIYWRLAMLIVALQIVLGGWVSTNYAALACNGFPQCQGGWAMPAGLSEALRPDRDLGVTAQGGALSLGHLAAIHYLHRLGAVLVLIVVLRLAWALRVTSPRYAALLLTAVMLQIGLGIGNVLLSLPLGLALAHHAGAAVLLGLLVYGYQSAQFAQQGMPALSQGQVLGQAPALAK